ncbi:hypothetical protein GCM10027436_53770 [Actinophytocola sediminis]
MVRLVFGGGDGSTVFGDQVQDGVLVFGLAKAASTPATGNQRDSRYRRIFQISLIQIDVNIHRITDIDHEPARIKETMRSLDKRCRWSTLGMIRKFFTEWNP